MNKKKRKQVEHAMKAMMSMRAVPDDTDPKFTRDDLDLNGRAKMLDDPAGQGKETE